MVSQRPSRREEFEVAIVCALETEFEAVCFVIEEFWDGDGDVYGKTTGDLNSYRAGRIGRHNVVLLLLSGTGKVHAAHAAASLYSSFTRLRLVLLVGGCAAVPRLNDADILLGDVIISTGVIQYDFGRKYPSGFFRKDTAEDRLSKPQKEIRNILAALHMPGTKNKLLKRTGDLLTDVQRISAINGYGFKYQYPGVREDKLYEASYRHKHRITDCGTCSAANDTVCDAALQATCEDLGCEKNHLLSRKKLANKLHLCQNGDATHQNPDIFFGAIGSGDMVMKSGEDRDELARKENIIAFEMEAAGIWEEVPSIVVKGVFDYGDSHKNKRWQAFASATAACAARAVIERFAWTDRGELQVSSHGKYGPFATFIYRLKLTEGIVIENNQALCGARQTNMISNATQNTSGFIKGNIATEKSEQSNAILFAGLW